MQRPTPQLRATPILTPNPPPDQPESPGNNTIPSDYSKPSFPLNGFSFRARLRARNHFARALEQAGTKGG